MVLKTQHRRKDVYNRAECLHLICPFTNCHQMLKQSSQRHWEWKRLFETIFL